VEASGGRAHYIDGATEPYNRSARHAPVMKSSLGDNRLEALDHQTGTGQPMCRCRVLRRRLP
jgi:hypothetical protein